MSDTPSNIVQQVILLATGAPGSVKLRDEILRLYETTVSWQQVAEVVDDYMNEQIPLTHHGIRGLVQAMASNGLGLKLSDSEAEQVTLGFVGSGIDSWSKLFVLAITELKGKLGKVLDNRAAGAENFTDLLASLNKDSDFNGLQTLNAAREWVQGIGVSDVSLLEGNKTASKLIAEFNHGNVRGAVLDNNVSGATVFVDENGNGIFDEGERSTITDQNGNFLLTGNVPRGNYIVTGGTDLATGRPFFGMLTAPEGAVIITPLTTLITLILRNNQAQNIDMAEELLFNALDIPRVDLSVFDSVASVLNSDTPAEQVTAVKIQAAVTQIVNLLNITNALISGFAPEKSNVVQAAQHALLAHLTNSTNTGQGLDLSSSQILATIIKDTGTLVGIIGENNSPEETAQIDTLVGQTAALLHEINALVQKATNMFENGQIPDAISILSDMIKLQTLVKADITSAIEANAPSGDLDVVVNEFTGINLVKNLDEIETGSFDSNTPVNDGSVITNPVTPQGTPTVKNSNNAPVITSDGGGATAVANVLENTQAVTTVTLTDVDGGTAVYTINGGTDAAKFSINSSSGVLAFRTTPDFESPTDANLDNIYEVVVQVIDDNGADDTQTISVTITDQNEVTVTTTSDTNDSGIVDGNLNHDIDWLNANMGTDTAISLREAIIATNNTTGTDTIDFNITDPLVGGAHTINVTSAFSGISDSVIIDGTTDSGFSGTPIIELDGSLTSSGEDGLIFNAGTDGSTVRGLVINVFLAMGLSC